MPELEEDNVQELLVVSNKLQIPAVETEAIEYVIKNLCISNCIETLKLGDKLGIRYMVDEATHFVIKHFCEIHAKCEDQLYQLPKHLFRNIFDSNDLVLASEVTGIVYTGLVRELEIIILLDKYLKLHPEIRAEFYLSSCQRLECCDLIKSLSGIVFESVLLCQNFISKCSKSWNDLTVEKQGENKKSVTLMPCRSITIQNYDIST